MKIRAVIVDDEPKLQEVLRIKLNRFCPQVEVLGCAENINDAEVLINDLKPDLVLLDITMPGGTGFDLLDCFEHIDFEVIFVTGYGEYAIQALKMAAVDYLLKPLNSNDLIEAIQRLESRLNVKSEKNRYDILKQNVNLDESQDSQIAIANESSYEFVIVKDIIHCEGWEKYTKIHLADGRVLVSSYNIGIYREMLDPYGFIQVHRSHLVNRNHLKRYSKEGVLILSDDSSVPVSRRKRQEFLEQFVSHR